jgi:hypothetical protein
LDWVISDNFGENSVKPSDFLENKIESKEINGDFLNLSYKTASNKDRDEFVNLPDTKAFV